MKPKHDDIPDDFEVQPLKAGETASERATCGHCGLSWDDGKVTSMTPAPSARCPFEAFHREQYDTLDPDDESPSVCWNCEWRGPANQTRFPIPDLWERIEPGQEVPVGECPECGYLAYIVETEETAR